MSLLSAQRDIARAKEQVIRYITKEAEVETRYKNFLSNDETIRKIFNELINYKRKK